MRVWICASISDFIMHAHAINAFLRRLPPWPVYILGVLAIAAKIWLAASGHMGPDPVRTLEQELGRLGLQELLAVMAITPLRRLSGISLLRFRRALALVAVFTIAAHLAVWLLLDVQGISAFWREIIKRPYITVGMAAFILMIPLAATSTNAAIRRMGARGWRRLHMLSYPVILLAGVHFIMLRKGWQAEPLFYMAAIMMLLALRLPWSVRPLRPRRG